MRWPRGPVVTGPRRGQRTPLLLLSAPVPIARYFLHRIKLPSICTQVMVLFTGNIFTISKYQHHIIVPRSLKSRELQCCLLCTLVSLICMCQNLTFPFSSLDFYYLLIILLSKTQQCLVYFEKCFHFPSNLTPFKDVYS